MDTLEFGPATHALAGVVAGVRDDQLGDPTPCPAYTVGDLVDHIGGLTIAFTAAARKERLEGDGRPPRDSSRLGGGLARPDRRLARRSWARPGATPRRTTG